MTLGVAPLFAVGGLSSGGGLTYNSPTLQAGEYGIDFSGLASTVAAMAALAALFPDSPDGAEGTLDDVITLGGHPTLRFAPGETFYAEKILAAGVSRVWMRTAVWIPAATPASAGPNALLTIGGATESNDYDPYYGPEYDLVGERWLGFEGFPGAAPVAQPISELAGTWKYPVFCMDVDGTLYFLKDGVLARTSTGNKAIALDDLVCYLGTYDHDGLLANINIGLIAFWTDESNTDPYNLGIAPP